MLTSLCAAVPLPTVYATRNLDVLRATLEGTAPEGDAVARQVQDMMAGFLSSDEEAVRAAMKTM